MQLLGRHCRTEGDASTVMLKMAACELSDRRTVVGACIGLLYSSGTPVAQAPSAAPNISALANALSLTASGIAFLVGFGVEGVVTMLQSVVHRLFPTT